MVYTSEGPSPINTKMMWLLKCHIFGGEILDPYVVPKDIKESTIFVKPIFLLSPIFGPTLKSNIDFVESKKGLGFVNP